MSIEFIFASLLLALLPGPDILYVLTQSVSRGFKAAFCVSLGLVSGLFVHTAAVAFGVAALVAASPKLLQGLQYLGALYLFWLGVGAVRSGGGTPAVTCEGSAQETHTGAWFYRTGVIMNLLNPKVILFFLSFFPGFLPAGEVHVWRQTFGLGATFAVVTLSVFTSVAALGGWLNRRFAIERFAASRLFGWVTAGVFWLIGLWIAFS